MTPFIHTPLPTRVLFGRGFSAKVGAEAQRLGLHRPLVLTGRQQSERGRALAEKFGWPLWSGARMHTPVETTEAALDVFRAEGSDGAVALGGGSAIGLGKAMALRTDAPQICLPRPTPVPNDQYPRRDRRRCQEDAASAPHPAGDDDL